MCGIIGYIGHQKASPILINGLLRLEYRGYDSAGISTIEKNGLSVMKDKGRVKNLYNLDGIDSLEGTIGIAHTRWATHGKPSKENAHPHLDNSNSFAVVHNGIIENYNDLKKLLLDNGYTFHSQTDTEIIPNLIHYYYSKDKKNDDKKVLRAVQKACKSFKGSYALQVISKYMPDNMIVIRKDSPLVIGKGNGENYISSDIPAILSFTKDFYLLNDNEFALLSRDNVEFYDIDLNKIDKKLTSIEWNASAADKNGFDDYMLKEIFEQPTAIRETIGSRLPENESCNFDDLKFTKEFLSKINKIYIVACGTAMHAGLSGKIAIENLCNIPVTVDIASEFRYRNPIIDKNTLCIYISQSGETADTIAALKLAKSKGATTLAVSNVIGSSITREADYSIYTHAGPEIAVASTKAYTTQLIVLLLLGMYISQALGNENEDYKRIIEGIASLPQHIENILKDEKTFEHYASYLKDLKDTYYIGRSLDYATVLEGALKLKEVSYVHADAYIAGELKHGPIALIEQGSLVIAVATQPNIAAKTISNIQETIARGANVILFTIDGQEVGNVKETYILPDVDPILQSVLVAVPLQLIAYYAAGLKGCDVDKPRNLAKSVTVE